MVIFLPYPWKTLRTGLQHARDLGWLDYRTFQIEAPWALDDACSLNTKGLRGDQKVTKKRWHFCCDSKWPWIKGWFFGRFFKLSFFLKDPFSANRQKTWGHDPDRPRFFSWMISFPFTLSSIIMEVENGCIWKVTTIGGTRSLPWL